MTPNGEWSLDEKGSVLPDSNRFRRIIRNKLFLTISGFALSMLLLALLTGLALYYYYSPQTRQSALVENPCEQEMCGFGSLCLVDSTTRRAYCRCQDTCPDVFAPVCGDDRVAYSNECQLKLVSCNQQRRILVQREGPCDTGDPCESTDCLFGSSCIASHDGRTATCICPVGCPTSSDDPSGVICGTDGKNYQNLCELTKASCRYMKKIEIKFVGICDPCDGVECPTSQICQLDDQRNPICRCNSACSPDFRPMCGSDGKTYTNECSLRVEACKSKKDLRIIYTGECSAGANPCDSLQCGPYQGCDIDRNGKATCHCDETCEAAVRLVCASDGHTYINECEMKKEGCVNKKPIRLLYRGECGDRGACYHHPCESGAVCVVSTGVATCECPSCSEEFQPVCGTDGISYTNPCKLQREACEQQTDIAVAYTGLCTGCENKRCEYYAVCESDGRGNGKCVCPQNCIQVESLVCGSDAVTYLNECEMRVEACRKAQYVMVVSKGPCDLCAHVHCKFGARCEGGRCVCPTECPSGREEVCANDGVTYKNECEMRHAACLHDQELNMLFYGQCDDVYESQDEGSGFDTDCEEKSCKYGGICEYDRDGVPHCACSFQCSGALDPVCGSDGKLFDNECRLKEEACRAQKSVMPVHIEMCEEVREVPCAGEAPLVDPTTQKDYYCGEGMGSKLCPLRGYCHKSSAFAKCCKEIVLIKTCSESTYGCCSDGKTSAQGPHSAGCPNVCNCNRLGSFGLTCDPSTNQCFCKPGVGGPRCDRCEPGFWGMHRLTEDYSDGCTPCTCNLYGSVRDDCEQMTGRCVCKQGIKGLKCDLCPKGTVLGPHGCMHKSIAEPISGSCDSLVCHYGAECREREGNLVQCMCDHLECDQDDHSVCGSDGNTYASECQMKLFSCRNQKTIQAVARSTCPKDLTSNRKKQRPVFLKRRWKSLQRRKRMQDSRNVQHSNDKETVESDGLVLDIGWIASNKNEVLLRLVNNKSYSITLVNKNRLLELEFTSSHKMTTFRFPRRLTANQYHLVSFCLFSKSVALYVNNTLVGKRKIQNYTFYRNWKYFINQILMDNSKNKNTSFSLYPFGSIKHFGVHFNKDKEKTYAFLKKRYKDPTTIMSFSYSPRIQLSTCQKNGDSEMVVLQSMSCLKSLGYPQQEIRVAELLGKIVVNLKVDGKIQYSWRSRDPLLDESKEHEIALIAKNKTIELVINGAVQDSNTPATFFKKDLCKSTKCFENLHSTNRCGYRIHFLGSVLGFMLSTELFIHS